ncbi:hypothetical protein Ddye_029797 [Dipteronia dyeriana]|uniref:Transposase MuDR plant domain-containing protein n=1 Tax=Dipteronia dyeriana TaxID=168575 RepID=A0AAD9TGE0_9ROSI|nr:hypothetical protein Ddye_029797 [Dipteronia dyeriana]
MVLKNRNTRHKGFKSGFFDPYTMVVYPGGRFVYVDDNIVDYTEGIYDVVKEADVMSIIDLDMMCEKLGYVDHVLYWKAPGEGSSVPIEEEEVLAKHGGVAICSKGLDANVEKQNEELLFNNGKMDDDQMQALRELGKLNRKGKSQRTKMRSNYQLYDGLSDFKEVKLEVGQVLTSSKVFKEVIKEYVIRCGRIIWFPCTERGRVTGICKRKNTNCPWTIWASKYERNSCAFMIKTLNDKHTCPRINKNRHANSAWLFRRYTNELRHGGNLKMSEFLGQLRKDYVVQPLRSQVYRAKLKAGEIIEELKKTNLGSTVVISIELEPGDKHKFKRIYICFNACNQGRCLKLGVLQCSPIYSLLENLRITIMNRRAMRRAEIKRWDKNIDPKILEIFDLETKKSGILWLIGDTMDITK